MALRASRQVLHRLFRFQPTTSAFPDLVDRLGQEGRNFTLLPREDAIILDAKCENVARLGLAEQRVSSYASVSFRETLGSAAIFRRTLASHSKSKADKKKKREASAQERDEGKEDEDAGVDIPAVHLSMKEKMEAAIEALGRELAKFRTGRATSGMLDHVLVSNGKPLSHMAAVAVLDPQRLSVNVHDPSQTKMVVKAIADSPLGLSPQPSDGGGAIIVPVPSLTNETRQAMLKLVNKAETAAKESIRRARQDGLQILKKALTKEELPRKQKEVDEMTKLYSKRIEGACQDKEKQISSS